MRSGLLMLSLTLIACLHLGMGRHEQQYDQEARQAEKQNRSGLQAENPATGIARGVKTAALDSTTGFISETASGVEDQGPVVGTIEGARQGTGAVLDKTVKGAVKVATLGQGDLDHYEVEEPEANTGEPTKITIKIPGT